MDRAEREKRKLNNHGFSLVELLVAMAILGIVSLAVYTFMNSGARLYQKTSSDADIQSEAQLVANTISDLIIDCEVNISYEPEISNSVGGGAATPITAQGRILEISNSDYQFLIFRQEDNLFYLERRPSAADPTVYEAYDINNAELLAQNITAFDVDLSRLSGKGQGKNIVTFSMTYEKGGRKYSGNYQVNLRNDITVSANSINPQTKEQNLTAISVTPAQVTIDVKGKDNPTCPSEQKEKEFTANSDATNVGRENIFKWTMVDPDGAVVTYAQAMGDDDGKKYRIRFADDLSDVPSSFRIVARSTIQNKSDGSYAQGEAIVYFKKILDMNITPTRGVTANNVDPGTTAIFAANITDYNLTSSDRGCNWKLEYRKGTAEEWTVCNDSGIASGRVMGSSYAVQLGSKADEHYSFRLTATSQWDSTWSAEYTFGVTELATVPGVDSPSRGVEIDLTAMFTTGDYASYAKSNLPGLETIYKVDLQNFSGHDVEGILDFIVRDGKAYVYLDYGAVRYTSGSDALLFYNNPNIECVIYYTDTEGNLKSKDGVNWVMRPVKLVPSNPVKNGTILISKGSSYDVTFTTDGYNISKKNQIGIYLTTDGKLQNVNANEYGMLDFNPYVSVNYTGSLGNRYTLIQSGVFRITAKPEQSSYPTTSIPMKVTIDDYYKLVRQYASGDTSQLERSSYDFDLYVANVEGRDLFVQGPDAKSGNWNQTTIVYNGKTQVSSNPETWENGTYVKSSSVVLDRQITVGSMNITFKAVMTGDGSTVSYYVMDIDGDDYYYNSTYHCWKPMS
jgi:prepilin-type N-terminal cleavage/methylation domain-containing protein